MVEHLETRAYVDGKPRAVTWPGAPPADGSWRIEEVEQRASDGGFPRAVVNGKVHLLAPGNPIPHPDPAPDPDSYPYPYPNPTLTLTLTRCACWPRATGG